MKKYVKYIISFIFIALFTILLIKVKSNEPFIIDNVIGDFVLNIRNDILTGIIKVITNFGSAIFLIIFSLISFLFIKQKRLSISICINLVISFLFNYLLKIIINRPRPIESLVEVSGYSFPSGHSTVSLAFYGFIIFLVYKSNLKYKKILMVVLTFLIINILFSRIYLNAHYVSDVLGSICISIPYLIIFIEIMKKTILKKSK